jgi:hypothetical protein
MSLAVDILSMADFHDYHDYGLVVDRVNDAIGTLTNPILLFAGQFLAAIGPWIGGQRPDAVHDSRPIFFGQIFDLANR